MYELLTLRLRKLLYLSTCGYWSLAMKENSDYQEENSDDQDYRTEYGPEATQLEKDEKLPEFEKKKLEQSKSNKKTSLYRRLSL